jgi:nucleotide-binding universal stress UspA family protein
VPRRARTQVLVNADRAADAVGVPCTTELLIGYPPSQIAALADEFAVDLVVVGSRHLSGVKRFLLGSTSRALIGDTTRPLLVVPETVPEPALV